VHQTQKKLYSIFRVVIPIIGIFIGSIKIFGLEFETHVFNGFGVPDWFRIVFGTVQIAGAVIIFSSKL